MVGGFIAISATKLTHRPQLTHALLGALTPLMTRGLLPVSSVIPLALCRISHSIIENEMPKNNFL